MDQERLLIKLKRYHHGEQHAISSKELEVAFSVSGKKIRDAVNALRQRGEPICSDKHGYFYAVNEQEINRSIHQLTNRIINIAKAQRGLVKASAKFMDTGQLTLEAEVVPDQ